MRRIMNEQEKSEEEGENPVQTHVTDINHFGKHVIR
jgi:hypothetical protein